MTEADEWANECFALYDFDTFAIGAIRAACKTDKLRRFTHEGTVYNVMPGASLQSLRARRDAVKREIAKGRR